MIEFIPGLRFRKMDGVRRLAVLTEERIGYTIGNSLVLLDGIPIVDHEVIFKYDPLKIRKIDVYKGKYVFGGQILRRYRLLLLLTSIITRSGSR